MGALTKFSSTNKPVKMTGRQLSDFDLQQAYNNYQQTYLQVTGKAWSEDRFVSRAQNWVFYGTSGAYVAVRPQKSGALKLVTLASDQTDPQADAKLKAALAALLQENAPTWGLVSKQIAAVSRRAGFLTLTPDLVTLLFSSVNGVPPLIPSYVLVDASSTYKVNNNGTISVNDAELGGFEPKNVIVNRQWVEHSLVLMDQRLNSITNRLSAGSSSMDQQSYEEAKVMRSAIDALGSLIGRGALSAPVLQIESRRRYVSRFK